METTEGEELSPTADKDQEATPEDDEQASESATDDEAEAENAAVGTDTIAAEEAKTAVDPKETDDQAAVTQESN